MGLRLYIYTIEEFKFSVTLERIFSLWKAEMNLFGLVIRRNLDESSSEAHYQNSKFLMSLNSTQHSHLMAQCIY